MTAPARSTVAIATFLILAFGWSWTIGYAGAQARLEFPVLSVGLAMLSGFGPSLAAVAVVATFSGRQGLRDWLTRCINLRVGWRWFAFAFLALPAVMLIALGIHVLLGGAVPAPMTAAHIPLALLPLSLPCERRPRIRFDWRRCAVGATALSSLCLPSRRPSASRCARVPLPVSRWG